MKVNYRKGTKEENCANCIYSRLSPFTTQRKSYHCRLTSWSFSHWGYRTGAKMVCNLWEALKAGEDG